MSLTPHNSALRDKAREWAKVKLDDILNSKGAEYVNVAVTIYEPLVEPGAEFPEVLQLEALRQVRGQNPAVYSTSKEEFIELWDKFFVANEIFIMVSNDGFEYLTELEEIALDNVSVFSWGKTFLIFGFRNLELAVDFRLKAPSGSVQEFEPT